MFNLAKDGTYRGNHPGNYTGAGRKKKPLSEKIQEGKTGMTVMAMPEVSNFEGVDVPPPREFMRAQQKNGRNIYAEEIRRDTWKWLKERRCDTLVNPQLIDQYAMSVARWIQVEEVINDYGFLAKHPTTGAAIMSPYVKMAQDYVKQVNQSWFQISQIVRDNCSEQYSGPNPQDDIMERLLTMKRRRQE